MACRFTHHVRSIEALFVIMCAYIFYLIAEIFHFSGILAMTFCGITMKNYVHANISPVRPVVLGIARVRHISSISFMFAELPAHSQVHDQDAGPCDGDDRFHLPGNFVHQQRTSLELAFCVPYHTLLHRLQVSGKRN